MKPRILVVDDSALSRRTLRFILEALGYEVEEASDGAQALERYFLNPPDLVMLDLVMTGMYGLDVLAKLKEINPEVRVIVATADIQSSTAAQVREAGAKGIVNKPASKEKLTGAVKTVLEGGTLWN